MDRQTLRDWVHRDDPEGDRPRLGYKPLLSEDQLAEFNRMVETPKDLALDGVVRWRCMGLKARSPSASAWRYRSARWHVLNEAFASFRRVPSTRRLTRRPAL